MTFTPSGASSLTDMQTQEKTLIRALTLLEAGDWQQAHAIVQDQKTQYAYWLHGIVHLLENDLENAEYWYKRAKRTFSSDVPAELAAARAALEQD